jgi:hypothetical protein
LRNHTQITPFSRRVVGKSAIPAWLLSDHAVQINAIRGVPERDLGAQSALSITAAIMRARYGDGWSKRSDGR